MLQQVPEVAGLARVFAVQCNERGCCMVLPQKVLQKWNEAAWGVLAKRLNETHCETFAAATAVTNETNRKNRDKQDTNGGRSE
jgi:hypothetical protein